MSLVLPVDATDEVVATGFCVVFAAKFVGLSQDLSLEGGCNTPGVCTVF